MSKQELAGALQARYLKARRQQKTQILDEFCAATGYHRKYALGLVRHGSVIDKSKGGAGVSERLEQSWA